MTGNELKKIRKSLMLTQKDCCKKFNISRCTLSKLESNLDKEIDDGRYNLFFEQLIKESRSNYDIKHISLEIMLNELSRRGWVIQLRRDYEENKNAIQER